MRSKTMLGALLVSVALCSQGFGFELLDRMLGLNNGGCGECNACAKVACCANPRRLVAVTRLLQKPACCEKTCVREELHLREVPSHPGARPLRRPEGAFRGQGLLLRDKVLRGRQGLLPGTRLLCQAGLLQTRLLQTRLLQARLLREAGLLQTSCCKPACCKPACCEKPACCKPACCAKPTCCEKTCCETTCEPSATSCIAARLSSCSKNLFGDQEVLRSRLRSHLLRRGLRWQRPPRARHGPGEGPAQGPGSPRCPMPRRLILRPSTRPRAFIKPPGPWSATRFYA